ncbi:MAG: PD40 domain-containing protein [Candidatus Zixiibacteriota bacterium]|nr:MAG: PD40 domain-containing protein [candidate division Zixibacteria bacterium]
MLLLVLAVSAAATEKLPPDMAGEISPPTGRIAFIRAGDIWVMEAIGTNQQAVCRVSNAEGRLSWSADNKKIVFTRSGMVDLKRPDLVGGRHKVYDLFICLLDSAQAGNRKYWVRLTHDVGSRGPEWSSDGRKIIFWKDMNANTISARTPNYQLCTVEPDGSNLEVLRPGWEGEDEQFLVTPSINQWGDIAFVFFAEMQPGGLVILPRDEVTLSLDSIKVLAEKGEGCIAPSWSPDGRWLAVVCQSETGSGLYIVSPDLQQRYLVAEPPSRTRISNQPPSFSPDSKWLTFATGDNSIWICDITGGGLRRLTSPGKDQAPCWSR